METQSGEIERITKRELSDRLQKGEDVVVVDAREAGVFEVSNITPKDSVRIAPGVQNGEIARLPRDKLIVPV